MSVPNAPPPTIPIESAKSCLRERGAVGRGPRAIRARLTRPEAAVYTSRVAILNGTSAPPHLDQWIEAAPRRHFRLRQHARAARSERPVHAHRLRRRGGASRGGA